MGGPANIFSFHEPRTKNVWPVLKPWVETDTFILSLCTVKIC